MATHDYRYSILAADAAKSSPDPKKASAAILKVIETKELKSDEYQCGNTKVSNIHERNRIELDRSARMHVQLKTDL